MCRRSGDQIGSALPVFETSCRRRTRRALRPAPPPAAEGGALAAVAREQQRVRQPLSPPVVVAELDPRPSRRRNIELRQGDQPVAFRKWQRPKQAVIRYGGGCDAGAAPDSQHDNRHNRRQATGENAAPRVGDIPTTWVGLDSGTASVFRPHSCVGTTKA